MTTTPQGLRAFTVPGRPGTRVLLASAGLACCAMEVEAAVRRGLLADAPDAEVAGGEDAPGILVVAGTLTQALGPAVRQLLADLPAGTRVLSFGACAATGGPYWDAPTVDNGVDQLVPVDAYVPGCPPRPAELVAGLLALTADGGAPDGRTAS